MPAVKLERVGRVARILLNMPEKMNAMTSQVVDDFGKVLDKIRTDASEYGAVVITGAGNSFSAGGDLAWLKLRGKDTPSRNSQIMHDFYHRFLAIRSLPLPVVAAINGPAVGAGMCLAMACDIRVASQSAKMGFPFVSLGLHPGMGATHMIQSVAGFETAYRLLLTGDLVTGLEAKELRLVSQVAPDGPTAQAQAMELAERIALQAPVAVRSLVRSLRRKQEEGLEAALWREADAQAHCYATHDLSEGLKASLERRPPRFELNESYVDRLFFLLGLSAEQERGDALSQLLAEAQAKQAAKDDAAARKRERRKRNRQKAETAETHAVAQCDSIGTNAKLTETSSRAAYAACTMSTASQGSAWTKSAGRSRKAAMPPKAPTVGSLRTEKGLAELNELLSSRSYVGGTIFATAEDMTFFAQVPSRPDRQKYPHLLRWYNHIAGLRARHAPYHVWPGQTKTSQDNEPAGQETKKGPRAPGKEKQVLPFDCKVEPVEDRRQVQGDDSVKRGAGGNCFPSAEKGPHGRYYITTAINYCNGWPHIGHAYEALTSDVFARYHRLLGQDVFFMTGADEHGQKIAQAAENEGLQPQEICDRYCLGFRALNQRLNVSNDFYVRTTADRHKVVARSVWDICKKKGDIYLDRYEGWYMVREERFITDQEAQEFNFKDPTSGAPLKKMSEPSFFFRLSKYQEKVIKLIEDRPEFIQPAQYRGEILERLKSIELRDLSISRGTFDWGVSCPEDLVDGKEHVMYVWFDALINYLSGIDGIDPKKPLSRFWPANMHIVGKDIHWFHTVIWPAMLMSSGIPLPKSVVVHGFIAGADGRKMSKSLGNSVDPHDTLDKFPCDTLRWYFCREAAFGDDVKFSEDSLRLMHNAELCDNLGNLVNRAVNLSGGSVPRCDVEVSLPFDLKELKASVSEAFEAYRLSDAADFTVRAAAATNKWIADLEPWKMKAEDQQARRSACLRKLLEAVYVLAHFFAPFIPVAAEAIFTKVGQPPRPIPELRDDFANLEDGKEVKATSLLFSQLEVKKVDVDAATEKKAEAKAKADSKKK
eukprot:s2205_g7.t1